MSFKLISGLNEQMLGLEGVRDTESRARVRLIMRISRINWSLEPQSLFQAGFFVVFFGIFFSGGHLEVQTEQKFRTSVVRGMQKLVSAAAGDMENEVCIQGSQARFSNEV